MIKGIYTAAAGMLATQLAADNTADNLANINTTGFKARATQFQSFGELILERIQKDEEPEQVGSITSGSQVRATIIDFSQGSLRQTGNPLDLAIEGDGFFQVETPEGQEAYTRNGVFTLNEEGFITTTDGNYLLNQGGQPINIPQEAGVLSISSSGIITDSNGQELEQIGLVQFEDNNALQKLNNSLYISDLRPDDLDFDSNTQILQGFIEGSNTNPISELVGSINGLRLYGALQNSIQTSNDSLGRVINEAGRPL